MEELLPNGLLGLAITGLLAAFMAGMAANVSAFNTVFSYDLWQDYVVKDRDDDYYLRIGRIATVMATVIAVGTATFAASFPNIMQYLQTLFSFFNAPLFATFIVGMFWRRMTPTAGWVGLVSGTVSAVLIAVVSLATQPKPAEQLRGLVYSETPKEMRTDPNEASYPWYRRTVPMATLALVMVIALNAAF